MSQVPSSDSLNERRTSSDWSKDPASPTAPNIPSRPPGGPEAQRPGPSEVRRSSKEAGAEEESAESPTSNGCVAR